MKYIIFILVLIPASTCLAQTRADSIDRALSGHICNCVEKNKALTEETFLSCFQESFTADQDLIRSLLAEPNIDTTEQAGYELGQALFARISVKFVFSCDAFYHLMDTIRYGAFRDFNLQAEKATVDRLSIAVKTDKTGEKYRDRGMAYFRMRNDKKALEDFNNALAIDSTDLQSTYFKAWALENIGQLDDAEKLYMQVAGLTKKNEILIIAAVVRRKKNGL